MLNKKIKLLEVNENICMEKDIEGNFETAGVWALYGVEKSSEKKEWKCLQVGQSNNISLEVSIDFNYLNSNYSFRESKSYVNQFGEKMFEFSRIPTIREVLYVEIAEKYHKLIFICVSKESDEVKRRELEKYFAWMTRSLYWRNGRPYDEEKKYDENELERQKNIVLNQISKNKKIEIDLQNLINCIENYLEENIDFIA